MRPEKGKYIFENGKPPVLDKATAVIDVDGGSGGNKAFADSVARVTESNIQVAHAIYARSNAATSNPYYKLIFVHKGRESMESLTMLVKKDSYDNMKTIMEREFGLLGNDLGMKVFCFSNEDTTGLRNKELEMIYEVKGSVFLKTIPSSKCI